MLSEIYVRGYSCNSANEHISSPSNTEPVYTRGDFKEVQEYVMDIVIEQGKVASMKTLHGIYGLDINDTRYRSKIKNRIRLHFQNQISFTKL